MLKTPRFYIWTIGCQMNKSESERLAGYLAEAGYRPAADAAQADLVILNGCVVRQSAENKVMHKLQALKAVKKQNPQVIIAVTGCIVGADISQLRRDFPYVDYFFGAGEPPPWLDDFEASRPLPRFPQVATYVPIMQGCNNFCAYCIVPYRRGRERSRLPEAILAEVKELVSRGVREVTLLGQNVDSYGRGLAGEPDLADLLRQLNAVDGLYRIRFLTNHPKDMKCKLIDAIASLEKVCEQINLPIQAGDDEILQAMRRGYTVEQYCRLISEIRYKVPEIALSTDVIVGFPGETDKQFQHTLGLLSEIKFDMVHVAAYSPRPGTLAARELADNVPAAEKKRRLDAVEQLQAGIAGEINARTLDTPVEVLVEGQEKGKWQGRTRTDKLVFLKADGTAVLAGQLVNILIKHTSPWSLTGELAPAAPLQ